MTTKYNVVLTVLNSKGEAERTRNNISKPRVISFIKQIKENYVITKCKIVDSKNETRKWCTDYPYTEFDLETVASFDLSWSDHCQYSFESHHDVVASDDVTDDTDDVVASDDVTDDTDDTATYDDVADDTDDVVAYDDVTDDTDDVVAYDDVTDDTDGVVASDDVTDDTDDAATYDDVTDDTDDDVAYDDVTDDTDDVVLQDLKKLILELQKEVSELRKEVSELREGTNEQKEQRKKQTVRASKEAAILRAEQFANFWRPAATIAARYILLGNEKASYRRLAEVLRSHKVKTQTGKDVSHMNVRNMWWLIAEEIEKLKKQQQKILPSSRDLLS